VYSNYSHCSHKSDGDKPRPDHLPSYRITVYFCQDVASEECQGKSNNSRRKSEAENPKKEISMYINSPGGVVTSGLAIYDTMQFVRPAVSTLCVGQAASMGSLLLTAGHKDMRFALPNARIMLHQPSGGFQGQATDIMLHAQEILNLKKRLNEIYVRHTGQPLKRIEDALERDMFLTAEGAKEFGIVDKVIDKRAEEVTDKR